MNWKKIRYNYWPRITWYITGRFIFDALYSYYWLNIAGRERKWPYAVECDRRWCRHCGKGKK